MHRCSCRSLKWFFFLFWTAPAREERWAMRSSEVRQGKKDRRRCWRRAIRRVFAISLRPSLSLAIIFPSGRCAACIHFTGRSFLRFSEANLVVWAHCKAHFRVTFVLVYSDLERSLEGGGTIGEMGFVAWWYAWTHALLYMSPYVYSAIGIGISIGVSVLGASWYIPNIALHDVQSVLIFNRELIEETCGLHEVVDDDVLCERSI